jgi:hypothetical protein
MEDQMAPVDQMNGLWRGDSPSLLKTCQVILLLFCG